MGYSCTCAAMDTLDRISDVCYKQTKSQNVYLYGNNKYFWEIGEENSDGAITGEIYKYLPNGYVSKSGDFRIEPDGDITRGIGFKTLYFNRSD